MPISTHNIREFWGQNFYGYSTNFFFFFCNNVSIIEDKIFATDFLRFFQSFQKNVKSHVLFKCEKNEKYVFSNTDVDTSQPNSSFHRHGPRRYFYSFKAFLHHDMSSTTVWCIDYSLDEWRSMIVFPIERQTTCSFHRGWILFCQMMITRPTVFS